MMVLASAGMARRLAASIPDIEIPAPLVQRVAADPVAGVGAACEQIARLRESGAFDGVHLVPVQRYREVAARLEALRGLTPGTQAAEVRCGYRPVLSSSSPRPGSAFCFLDETGGLRCRSGLRPFV